MKNPLFVGIAQTPTPLIDPFDFDPFDLLVNMQHLIQCHNRFIR